ncbi:hypothetical protein JZ751_012554 [Albula glossodonta]|uniref:Cadherin domain-containing protein n=1 Tax=Albula glossodonta TaxID=121402 RepID=A0A8T2NVA7_9TELE|nr:hypothetical protein JZ751_012554 [Albula glossodonta]
MRLVPRILLGCPVVSSTVAFLWGDILVKDPSHLDFEERRRVHLVVLADNGWQTAHCRVTIALLDVNDNTPMFEQQYYKTAVWEGQIHNTYVMQVFALDADSGVHGQVNYSILSGNHNNAFVIDSTRGILATNDVLDREIVSSYKLVLQAVDRGSPPLTATTTVRVQVVDVNDNSPSIPPMDPVLIAENLPAGYVVTQVAANDVDLSSTVTYSFAESGVGCFAIDPFTGVITLTQTLDHEEATSYTLRVQASDSVHQTEANITVKVLDINDNPPVFSEEAYQVVLPELSSVNTFVMALSATDRDSGLNGKVSYRLLSSSIKGYYINPENGSIFTNKPLTYITNGNVIQLLVEARDGGDPPLSAVTSVEVHVQDANDHAPCFQHASYQVSVSEDSPMGTTLLVLQADDGDWSPENAFVDYVITGGNEARGFCLEASTAQQGEGQQRPVARLVLCGRLDRETSASHTLIVTASDRGTPPLNGSTTISVTVLDVNDNAPEFGSPEYQAKVSEGSSIGTKVAKLSAHDPDEGSNAQVRYDIISGNGKGLFRLDWLTGVVEVNRSLDYEEDTKFTLTVQASDGNNDQSGGSRNVAFAVLYISVLDENDNSPYFAFSTVNCSVTENQPAFSLACTVHAIDRDAGPYGQLAYSILSPCFLDYGSGSPDRKEAFSVDPLTGDIHTRQTFDYEREREYCFLVEARDRGDQTATVRVQISIEGADEFSPVFTRQQYLFHLPENARAGQSIGQVTATDQDAGQDGVLEYALTNPSPFFSVNKTSGAIYLLATVYKRRSSGLGEDLVDLLVTARSPKLDSRSASCLVIVNISNSAPLPPGMTLSAQTVSLGVFLLILLLLLVFFIFLVLRFKRKEAAMKKSAPRRASSLNRGLDGSEKMKFIPGDAPDGIGLQDLRGLVDIRAKRELLANPYRHSDSSGRGSAEGETAEDEEIKMINEHPGSGQSGRDSHVPDSGVPQDSDSLSCQLEEATGVGAAMGEEVPVVAIGNMVTMVTKGRVMESSESLHNFREEGGGEEMMLPRPRPIVLAVRDGGDGAGLEGYTQAAISAADLDGSLTSLVCADEELRGSYGWDYLLNWEPRFQPLASVFSELGQLPDEEELELEEEDQPCRSLRPPPLITSVAQPGLRAVPPRMPPSGVAPILTRRPSFPKYSYSPLARNTGLTPSIMTPSFSPALSLLTIRTPNASPVHSPRPPELRTDTESLMSSDIAEKSDDVAWTVPAARGPEARMQNSSLLLLSRQRIAKIKNGYPALVLPTGGKTQSHASILITERLSCALAECGCQGNGAEP